MRVDLHLLVDTVGLEQERHGVDPEPGQALGQPEPDDLADLGAHRLGGHVEVGLVLVEPVQVVLPGLGVEAPHALLLAREDDSARAAVGHLVLPHVELAERATRGSAAPPGTTGADPRCG